MVPIGLTQTAVPPRLVFKKGPTYRGSLFGAVEVRGCHFRALVSMPLKFYDVKVRSSGFGLGLSFDQKKLKA